MKHNIDFFAFENNFTKKQNISSACIYDKRGTSSLVTIGIPTYKRSSTLKDAIESALCQDFEFQYDILVLDNNPERNDETEALMNEYLSVPHVSYYKNTSNLGMGGNWNRIVELANTTWVVFLHDDDIIAPTFLSDMINIANLYNADVVNSAFKLWFERKEKKPQFIFKKSKYKVIQSTLKANFFIHRAGMPTGILWKRDVYIKEGGVNDDYYPSFDWVFNTRLSSKYKFLLYEKELTIYRYAVNTYTKKETIKAYIALNSLFIHYVGELVGFSKWFVDFYSNLHTKSEIARLGIDSYCLNGKIIKRISIWEKILFLGIIKISKFYFDKRNYHGMA